MWLPAGIVGSPRRGEDRWLSQIHVPGSILLTYKLYLSPKLSQSPPAPASIFFLHRFHPLLRPVHPLQLNCTISSPHVLFHNKVASAPAPFVIPTGH